MNVPVRSRTSSRRMLAALIALVVLPATGCSGVQGGKNAASSNFPTRAIQFTVPFPPGGSTDLVGRAIARAAEKPLGQSLAVTNKPGANGAIGGKEVLASAPDGYNVVLLVKSLFAMTPLVVKDPTAIQLDKLDIVSTLTIEDFVLIVNANSKYKTLEDVLAAPSIRYATNGVGTGSHLSQALLFKSAGVNATDVPFDGAAPAVTSVLGEQVDVYSGSPVEIMQQLKAGKFRPLAIFSAKRSAFIPDVPTAKEKGFDVVVDQRRFVVAPPGLSDTVSAKLTDGFAEARKDTAYDRFLADNFVERWEVSDEEARKHIREAADQYAELVRKFGLTFGS